MQQSHAYISDLPTINPNLRFLLKSHFISSIIIFINYHGIYNNKEANGGIFQQNFDEDTEWSTIDLDFALTNLKYYYFYNNFNTLINLMQEDNVKVYVLPFGINKESLSLKDMERQNDFIKLIDINNNIMKSISEKKNLTWIPYFNKRISNDDWLGDICHFNSNGNRNKALFISKYIEF